MNRAGRLVSNVLYTLNAKLVLLGLSFVTVPILVRGLGVEAYGLYALTAVLIGYFTFLDLGTSQALVKHLSEALARGEQQRAQRLIETGLTLFLSMGVFGGLVIGALAESFALSVLHVPSTLADAAQVALRLAAVGFTVTMAMNGLLAVPLACQRLDIVAKMNAAIGSMGLIIPAILVSTGFSLPSIITTGVLLNVAGVIILVGVTRRLLPDYKLRFGFDWGEAIRLWKFGGSVLVSTVAAQVSLQVDKLIISALLPISRLSYYSVPFNLAAKMLVIPYAVGPALFPAVTEVSALGLSAQLKGLYLRTTKALCAVSLPFALLLLIYADKILEHWIGADFAVQGTTSLRVLAVAFFVVLMTQPATDVARGVGRPGIGAIIAVIDALAMIGFCFVLISWLGIDGAAVAFLLATNIGAAVFVLIVQRTIVNISAREMLKTSIARPALAGLGCAAALWGLRPLVTGLASLIVVALVVLASYAAVVFSFVFDRGERSTLIDISISFFRRKSQRGVA